MWWQAEQNTDKYFSIKNSWVAFCNRNIQEKSACLLSSQAVGGSHRWNRGAFISSLTLFESCFQVKSVDPQSRVINWSKLLQHINYINKHDNYLHHLNKFLLLQVVPLHYDSVWVNNFQNQFSKSLEHLDYAHDSQTDFHRLHSYVRACHQHPCYRPAWLYLLSRCNDEQMACRRAADSCHTSKGLFPLPQMLSGKIPDASSIVLCFHTPSPLGWRTPQNAISASLKDSKAVWHRHFLLHMFVLSGMCVDYCFMSIWFMICSYPRSVSLNSFSFFSMDVMFLPSPSHYQTHVFCTHTSGGSVTT